MPFALQRKVDALNGQLIVDFSAGENHSLAVNEFGDVFAWYVAMQVMQKMYPYSKCRR